MPFIKVQHIPDPDYFFSEVPLSKELRDIKAERDDLISGALRGESDRLLLIIGPCSADNEASVCDYVSRLAKVQQKVADKLVLVPRIYTNKPRSTGEGYKGMMHQPDPNAEPDILKGIRSLRMMHVRALKESHLSAADEMLYPENYAYLEDLLSYVAIGARSSENQQHRLVCSGLDVPVGVKNPTGGDLTVMMNSIYAVQCSHNFKYHDFEVRTTGNPLGHAVLRGAMDHSGRNIPNYHYEHLMLVADEYARRELKNPAVIVDTNHSNSMKHHREQPRIAFEVLTNMRYSTDLRRLIRGFMVESYIVEGAQEPPGGVYGKSVTDACLGWEDTEKLILEMADMY
jgi:3-deoxy-7-phosphoheptulonate synthase